ncbi:MAG: arginyltransferase [Deltaproteobacteria bacterium]|jgi:arginine-tRNA-protein transferase|nr:arginyltransferase [Deltaproteobacteria bacterium]MBW2536280.1 arginyltransferase [Deltaproteobacteria bacterium]
MAAEHPIRIIDASPPEVVVHDEPGPCAYLVGHSWRLPLRLPLRTLRRTELERRLAIGDRRQGRLLYRPSCPGCQACEPIRIDVEELRLGRTQRRVWSKGTRRLQVELGAVRVDDERLSLYHRHKRERGLEVGEGPLSEDAYRLVFGESCCETFELRYRLEGRLIAIAITDRSARSLSAVYTYFDPSFERMSPGVFSILTQVELCRRWGLRYLYLGLYIADCPAMAYKGRYLPHQRRVGGRWITFDRD